MESILLRNILHRDKRSDIFVEDGIIKRICPAGTCPFPDADFKVDCTGKAVMPGFVNMHTHAAMSLMRGMQEDVVFQTWIENIWDIEAKIDEEFVYWGSKVACLEMIKSGTTTFNDQYWFFPATQRAASEMGIRPVVSYVVLDKDNPVEAERQKEQCQRMFEISRGWNRSSRFGMAFHAVYSVSEPMILWATEFAREHGLKLHIHLSETRKEVEDCKKRHGGLSPVEYLERLGVLDENLVAAHTLWLSEKDVELLGKHHVTCVHNINSNAKLASGYRFLSQELMDAGANVCIGTDGCASSNNLDMLEAMKTSALFEKAWRNDPKALPLDDLIRMTTSGGAKALGINTGKVREGMEADLLIVDTDNSYFLSPGPFLANFVYSAHSDCIDSVICQGKFVMRNRIVEGEKEILANARKVLRKIL